MGVLAQFWSALNQPNTNGYRHTVQVPPVDVDAVRDSIEAEALESVLGEISPEQVVERVAEKYLASMKNPAEFESRVAALVAEKCKVRSSKRKGAS